MEELICEWCHRDFERASKLGLPAKYCSGSCRVRAFEATQVGYRLTKKLDAQVNEAAKQQRVSPERFVRQAVEKALEEWR